MTHVPRILVLDDEPNIVEVLITRLEAMGYHALGMTSPSDALDAVSRNNYEVLLTDLKMPQLDGMSVLKEAKRLDSDLEVIIVTAYGSVEGAVEAMKQGAYDFIEKPFNPGELERKIAKAIEKRDLSQRVRYLEQAVEDRIEHDIFAQSPAMKKLLALTRRVSSTDATVLVLGESGTGKELIARMLHFESRRKNEKFVIMDCGATPATLIETELFGCSKGAFTGAVRDKKGIIEEADSGTLFLDEIGNISPEMQTRLLRVLESGEFRRVGDLAQRKVNIRVIAATNADLEAKVRKGEFREDLYFRLKVITIELPPLRDRREDVPGLTQRFITEFSRKTGKPVEGVYPEAMNLLTSYAWPGNVRELKNVIESAVVLCRQKIITPDDILFSGIGDCEEEEVVYLEEGLNVLETQERTMLIRALKKNRWVQKDAADMLGISRRVMNYKIKKYNIRQDADPSA